MDAVVMDTAAIDLVRQSGQLQMLITPALVGSTLGLVVVVLTGWPGRALLAMQTRIAVNRDARQKSRR